MAKFFKRLQAVGRSVGFMFVYPRAVIGNEQKEMEYATGRRFLFGWKPRAKRSGPSVADNVSGVAVSAGIKCTKLSAQDKSM